MLKAFNDSILVTIVIEEKKKGLLIVPDERKEYNLGIVYSIGKDVTGLSVGGKVFFSKYAGSPIEYGEMTFFSVNVKEIKAIIED